MKVNKSSTFNNDENLLRLLMGKLIPFWPLFAVLLFISAVAAKVYLYYATPVYEASATLIIKDEKKGVDDSNIMESTNAFSSKKIVENEIEVIKSRALMKQVVNDLRLYAPILEDQKVGISSAYLTSPIIVELSNPNKIVDSTTKSLKYYFYFDSLRKEVEVNNIRYPINKWVESPFGMAKFTLNERRCKTTESQLYFTFFNPKGIINDLVNKLDVSAASKLSTVVNLKFKDPVPQRGEDILNQLIYAYNQASVTDRNTLAANTLSFIEDRIQYVENDLDDVEREVQQYKSLQGVVDLSEQGRLYLQKVGDNDLKIEDINLQLAVLDNVEKYVISKENRGGIVPSTLGVNDAMLSQLLEKLYNSEIEYEKLRKTTAENNPILIAVANEIEKIRPSILENVHSQRDNLKSSLKNLGSTNGKYTSALQTIPQKERDLLEINRKKYIKNELFSFLLQKREETALSYAPTAGESRVIDVAESSMLPVSPNKHAIYAIAMVVALGLGFTFILFKEFFNNNILFRSEIEDHTSVPVVGELLYVKQTKKQLLQKYPNRFVLEQLRDIRVAMGLFGVASLEKRILITSSVEGEGKSFVSENLAISLALSGKQVVLLNFDLLKPDKASLAFDGEGQRGIAEYLSGDLKPFELLNPTKYDNLYVVLAGTVTNQTSDLLLEADLEVLFSYLNDVFDYIIVDTPPMGVSLYACVLSKYCDSTLFITRHNHTPIRVLQRLDQNNNFNELKNPKIVFNGVKSRGFINTGYGLNYGYKDISLYKLIEDKNSKVSQV